MTHSDLVDIAYKWVLKNAHCGVAAKEIRCITMEQPDVIGFGSNGHSVMIEVKVSRADFLRDAKKLFRKHQWMGVGSYRAYCCPTGLIKVEELPDRWGLLYVNEKGKVKELKSVVPPNTALFLNPMDKNNAAERDIMYSILRRNY